jgi:hypothetical protein
MSEEWGDWQAMFDRWSQTVDDWLADAQYTEVYRRQQIKGHDLDWSVFDEVKLDWGSVRDIKLDGRSRVWLNDIEITDYLAGGKQPLALDGDRVVYARSGREWRPR